MYVYIYIYAHIALLGPSNGPCNRRTVVTATVTPESIQTPNHFSISVTRMRYIYMYIIYIYIYREREIHT